MTTANSTNNSLPASAPLGFAAGVLGGLAAYYLTHSSQGKKLGHRLLDIYDQAKLEGQVLLSKTDELTTKPPPALVDALDSPLILNQSRYASSLLKRFKAKLAQTSPASPPTKKLPLATHRFFTHKK